MFGMIDACCGAFVSISMLLRSPQRDKTSLDLAMYEEECHTYRNEHRQSGLFLPCCLW